MPAAIVKTKGKQYRVTEFGSRMLKNQRGKQTRLHTVTTPSGESLVIAPQEFATAEVIAFIEG